MDTPASLQVLLASTASIAFVHALAPDHWIPFTSIGRAQNWSVSRLMGVTLLSGFAHIGSSITIGVVGLALGYGLSGLEGVETQRGQIAGLLLIGFGIAYALWGLRRASRHVHLPEDPRKAVTIWMLIAIFLLGPCEPLIPLMFIAAAFGWHAVSLVSIIFTVITLVMMAGQAYLGFRGVGLFKFLSVNHRGGHAFAGAMIALTGFVVMVFGV